MFDETFQRTRHSAVRLPSTEENLKRILSRDSNKIANTPNGLLVETEDPKKVVRYVRSNLISDGLLFYLDGKDALLIKKH